MGNVPRKTVQTDPMDLLWAKIEEVFKAVEALQRASTLRNASVSGGNGIRMLQENTEDGADPKLRIWINPQDGTITAYNVDTGEAAVRMGRTSDGSYGLEVKNGSAWIQLGSSKVSWGEVGGKPTSFTPASHTHPGNQITGAVDNATEAAHSADTDGSQRAFNNNVSGTQFYAVWVGNDGKLGRNTSSKRYKENIRHVELDKSVLGVELARFDRKPQLAPPQVGIGPDNLVPGSTDELGVIAEQAHEHFPDATQWFGGQIDGVRYELYGAALIPVVRDQERRLTEQEEKIGRLEELVKKLMEDKP